MTKRKGRRSQLVDYGSTQSRYAGPVVLDLHPRQTEALLSPANEIMYGGAAGGGKALRLDTPIPTPSGWTVIGAINPGDYVLNEQGQPSHVSHVHKVIQRPDAYRLTFDDGSTIEACADHLWKTFTDKERTQILRLGKDWQARRRLNRASKAKGNKSEAFTASLTARNAARRHDYKAAPTGEIRTTRHIFETQIIRRRVNHAVLNALPLQLPEADLPINPYVLGAWLGGGTAVSGSIASADPAILRAIERGGYKTRKRASKFAHGILGLQVILRKCGLLDNKHIPPLYLRASQAQRIELLQGLMDTDGSVCESGSVEFCNTNYRIIEGAHELIVSLGWKATIRPGRATLNGRDCGPKWTIKWTPSTHVFKLPRKRRRQKLATRTTNHFRYIVRVESIEPVPMRCITLSDPRGMFLAGRSMIPTHNSHLMRAILIIRCFEVPGLQCYLFRRLYPDLIKNHMEGEQGFRALLAPAVNSGLCEIVESEIRFYNGARIYLCHLQDEKALMKYQGPEIHILAIDELTHFTKTMYEWLRARCRTAGLYIPPHLKGKIPFIITSANPGGPGHHWVKKTFVEQGPWRCVKKSKKQGGMIRQYVPAKLEDNPTLYLGDPEYGAKLEGISDPLIRRAMRDGDWDIVPGSVFAEIWNKRKHTCAPFAIPSHWPMWRGMDDGFAAPACVLWFAKNPDTGTIYVTYEVYKSGLSAPKAAERIKDVDTRIEVQDASPVGKLAPRFNDKILDGTLDVAAFANTGTGNVSRGTQMNNEGCKWKAAEKWPGSRIAGLQYVFQCLEDNPKDLPGHPGLVIFERCSNLIRTITALQRDEDDIEDVDTDGEDHAYDCLRYGLQHKTNRIEMRRLTGL